MKIIDDDSPFLRHCLIDFSPDHSYTTSPRVTGASRCVPYIRTNGNDLSGLAIINSVIYCTPTIDFTLYLETAAEYSAYFPSLPAYTMAKFSIINLATGSGGPREGTITLSASADVSITGSNVIQPSGSGAAGAGSFGLAIRPDVEMIRLA